jgi:glycerol transport system permease protein
MKSQSGLIPMIYVGLITIPLYWMVVLSVQAGNANTLVLFPMNPSIQYYAYILTNPDWYWGYLNAIIYVCINVVITIAVALPAAYAFSRGKFPGKRKLFFALLMFRMMVPAILLVPFVQLFSWANLIDTHIAVALAHCFFTVPLAIWILEGFISDVPVEIDESAALDGYTTLSFFRHILLPQIATGIAVAAFFCFMFSWIEFLLSNALTTIDAKPFGGIMSRAGNVLSAHVPLIATAGVLGLVPGLILAILLRKHLVRGFSLGRGK